MRRIILNILIMLSLAITPAAVFSGAASAACPPATSAKGQVLHGVNETGSDCSEAGVTHAFAAAVRILSIIAGAIAIIMIIYSGFKYTTSGGDASKISSAKTSLIYALVGVVVAALAQFLVRFVLTQTTVVK